LPVKTTVVRGAYVTWTHINTVTLTEFWDEEQVTQKRGVCVWSRETDRSQHTCQNRVPL